MKATIHFATYFDSRFLPQGLALYRSLEKHNSAFVWWVLCLDDETCRVLERLALPHARLVRLSELECADPALRDTKSNRLTYEYYWTCGPAFLGYLLAREPSIEHLAYVDADIHFFGDTSVLSDELGDGNILLHEHLARREADDPRAGGRFNVGVMLFRRSPETLDCLHRWREQCLAWCYDRHEEGRFGDQAYLDDWPAQFNGVMVARHPGLGMAPWRVTDAALSRVGSKVQVSGQPLIFYHFSKVRRLHRFAYQLHDWRFHRHPMTTVVRYGIYAPYVRALYAAEREIRIAGGHIPASVLQRNPAMLSSRARLAGARTLPFYRRWQRFMLVRGRLVL